MLNFEHSKEQTNDSIFNNLDDEAVYLKLLGYYPSTRQKYNSPFTVDLRPSFTFYMKDRLRWKDFSSGRGGTCLDLVMEMFNMDFSQACSYVKKNCPSDPSIQKTSREPSKPAKIEVVLFDKDPDSFYEYWDSFSVSKKTLELYNIRAAKEVWLNDKLYSLYRDDNPVIRYLINSKYKIYKPYGKSDKWISNTKLTDPQGWKQLPEKGNLLVVGKAMKDIMIFHELGVSAIALCSESCNIPVKMFENLSKRFRKIITFMDNDEAGFRAMIKIYNSYQIDHYWVPMELESKDIAEFCYNYGLEGTQDLLDILNIKR